MRTRIAPTPSGFLHEGNAVNFVLVSWLARQHGGVVVLRIDDMDRDRYRREYVDDVFAVLDWLAIAVDEGPSTTDQFEADYSMQAHRDIYRERMLALRASPLVETYACSCSRHQLALGQVCRCRELDLELAPERTALRVHVPESLHDVLETMGDFVVWRRDDTASYQLASVVEDERLAITHIVRGVDLLPSTAAQRLIAPAIAATTFEQTVVLHHPLITDASGAKLSKSQRKRGPMARRADARARILESAARIAPQIGIAVP